MPTDAKIDLKHVVSHCEAESERHRQISLQNSQPAMRGVRNEKLALEHAAKSEMASELASHFLSLDSDTPPTKEEIDVRARKLDPRTFDAHARMLERLTEQGSSPDMAHAAADAAYGDVISRLHREALRLLATEKAREDIEAEFEEGFRAAIEWHQQRALESERMSRDAEGVQKQRYAVRAKRHRFFVQELEADLKSRFTASVNQSQNELPFEPAAERPSTKSTKQIEDEELRTVKMQMAFMRKSEEFDDEGWS